MDSIKFCQEKKGLIINLLHYEAEQSSKNYKTRSTASRLLGLTDAGLMSRSVADMTYYHEHKHGLQVKAGNDPRLGEKAAYEFEKYQINSSTPDRYIKTTNSNYKYYGGKGAVYDSNYSNMLFNIFR